MEQPGLELCDSDVWARDCLTIKSQPRPFPTSSTLACIFWAGCWLSPQITFESPFLLLSLEYRGTFKVTRKYMGLGKWRLKASASPMVLLPNFSWKQTRPKLLQIPISIFLNACAQSGKSNQTPVFLQWFSHVRLVSPPTLNSYLWVSVPSHLWRESQETGLSPLLRQT